MRLAHRTTSSALGSAHFHMQDIICRQAQRNAEGHVMN